jgi:hypothetical protein
MVSVASVGCETTNMSQVMWNTKSVEEICEKTTKSASLRVVVKYC